MARVAEIRPPAEPSSQRQRLNHERMLEAAAELGAVNDFEHVQMQDVASRAGVAIATLYRYFPSKTHLFVSVMLSEIAKMSEDIERRAEQTAHLSPVDSASDVLTRALRALLRRPLVASSLIYSANAAHATKMPGVSRIDRSFQTALLAATRLQLPTVQDLIIIRLVSQQWFAVVQSCLNEFITAAEAESDITLACQLLLAPLSSVRRHRGEC